MYLRRSGWVGLVGLTFVTAIGAVFGLLTVAWTVVSISAFLFLRVSMLCLRLLRVYAHSVLGLVGSEYACMYGANSPNHHAVEPPATYLLRKGLVCCCTVFEITLTRTRSGGWDAVGAGAGAGA